MELIDKTIGQLLKDVASELPNNIGLEYNTREYSLTWKELDELTDKISKGFMSLGVQKGDKVAIWATNIPEWFLTLYATAKIGAVLVTVNTNYKIFELEYLLSQSDTKVLVCMQGFKDSNYVEIIKELVPEIDSGKAVIESEKLPFLKHVIFAANSKAPQGMISFDSLIELGNKVSEKEYLDRYNSIDCNEVVNMQYTSGTTGFPKGVMLSHRNVVNNGKTIGEGMALTSKDRLCICVPMFHCFGLVLAFLACLTNKASMVAVESYNPVVVMETLSKKHCTAVHGVPTMFIHMLEHPTFDQFDFSHLRTGIMAGSPCPIEIMKKVVDKMNMKDIVIVFGQTEASPGCTMTTTHDTIENRVATVGRAFPHVECKIINPDTNEEMPCGEPGEFVARGYNIMQGYYKMPEATRNVIDKDGWLHTGDLCIKNKDGYYKVVGRIKDMIIRGGENIYPKEIEEYLYTVDGISDVQVVGVPSEKYGEEVMAFIILKKNSNLTEDDIKKLVKKNMARHKVPSYVKFLDKFPTTASGKIQKYKLREMGIKLLSLHQAASIETA